MFTQERLPAPPPAMPFEKIGETWILNKPIQTSDYVQDATGFKLDPTTKYSKVFAFGGNTNLYDAVVSSDGSGQYTSIQDALNAGKTRIFVRSGTYAPFSITTGDISIVGENKYSTIIQMPKSSADGTKIINITAIEMQNIVIENLCIHGNSNYQDSGYTQYGIYVEGYLYGYIRNCYFVLMRGNAIYLNSVAGSSVENNIFFNIYRDVIKAVDSEENLIVNNYVGSGYENGFSFSYGQYNKIINNYIKNIGKTTDNTYSGIILSSNGGVHSLYNIITNNILKFTATNDPKYGIREDDANQDYNIISNNIVQGADTANISTQGVNSVVANNIT